MYKAIIRNRISDINLWFARTKIGKPWPPAKCKASLKIINRLCQIQNRANPLYKSRGVSLYKFILVRLCWKLQAYSEALLNPFLEPTSSKQ
jgi:hypothetical protein